MTDIGRIEKPESGWFAGKRKLCLVPFVFCGKDDPLEYVEKYNRYWAQAAEHIANLEARLGKAGVVYCESIVSGGEPGLKTLESLNPKCHSMLSTRVQSGAVLEPTEDKDLVEEAIDWERCLLIGLVSTKVARSVADGYFSAQRKRYEYIARRITETLKPDQMGLLVIQEGHGVQFPQDIEVFSVSPPALDELRRWQRDESQKARQKSEQPGA